MRARRILLISIVSALVLMLGSVVIALQKPHPLGPLQDKVASQKIRNRSAIRGGFTSSGPVKQERVRLVKWDCRLEGITFQEAAFLLRGMYSEESGWDWDDTDSGGRIAYLNRAPATLAGRIEVEHAGSHVQVGLTLESDWRDRILVLLSGMGLIR